MSLLQHASGLLLNPELGQGERGCENAQIWPESASVTAPDVHFSIKRDGQAIRASELGLAQLVDILETPGSA